MRRALVVTAGIVVALVGASILANAVEDVRDGAASAVGGVEVLVALQEIDALTPADQLASMVEVATVPEGAVVRGALSTLDAIDPGHVTRVAVLPGGQIVDSLFGPPQSVTRVDVPTGLQEITVTLDASRALGGSLVVGETVGIIGSFAGSADTRATSDFVLRRALVTAVRFTSGDIDQVQSDSKSLDGPVAALEGGVHVTLAVSSQDATTVAFTAEFGSLWLTRQDDDAAPTANAVTIDNVFAGAP
jgi:pilus assembly protein CpaB